jgi:hypothetical protein
MGGSVALLWRQRPVACWMIDISVPCLKLSPTRQNPQNRRLGQNSFLG